jgi:hypothetical protein
LLGYYLYIASTSVYNQTLPIFNGIKNYVQNTTGRNYLNESSIDSIYEYNIFFLETSHVRERFSFKELCSIESAAYNNPQAIVNVLSLSAKTSLDEHIALQRYKNIRWMRLEPEETFSGTPLLDWWRQGRVLNSTHRIEHLADALRLATLYKHGGFYSDLDTLTVRSLRPLSKYPAAVGYLNKEIGNGFLHFYAGHQVLLNSMTKLAKNYNPNS